MQPLVVLTDGSRAPTAEALVAGAGWRFVDRLPAAPWDLASEAIAIAGTVGPQAVGDVVGAAARGVATVAVTTDEATTTALVDDLARIGTVECWSPAARPPTAELTPEEVELLCALAAGETIGAAAQRLYLSRRTADRRLADARARLGVATTAEALCVVGELLESWAPVVPPSARVRRG